MRTNFANKILTRTSFLKLFIAALLFSGTTTAQTPTNIEVFYSLTDSLTNQVINEFQEEQNEIVLILNLGESYSLFSNHINTSFKKNDKKVHETQSEEVNIPYMNIVIEGAGVEYGEIFRDGWFGEHYITRYCTLFGNYLNSFSEDGKKRFEYSLIDTVKVEDIKYLESESFPFTQGNIPSEPFLSGFAEPLIAIGTAAAIVILFFSVRSK